MRSATAIPRIFGLFLAALLAPHSAAATPPPLRLSQFVHSRWLQSDGAPLAIYSMAQTPDGLLWLGTGEGLVRFDGASFDRVRTLGGQAIPEGPVNAVATDAKGALWIGFTGERGIGILDGHAYRSFVTFNKWQAIKRLYPARDGSVWISDDLGVWNISADGAQVTLMNSAFGLPNGGLASLALGPNGELVVATTTNDRIYELVAGRGQINELPRLDAAALTVGADGTIWGADVNGLSVLRRRPDGSRERIRLSRESYGESLVDREGRLWIQHRDGLRMAPQATALVDSGQDAALAADHFGVGDGLSSPVIFSMLEDRDGNLWVGTAKGLDRFRRGVLTAIALPESQAGLGLAPDDHGGVWAAGWRGPLMSVTDSGLQRRVDGVVGALSITRAQGELWVAGHRLWNSRDGVHFEAAALPPLLSTGALRDVASDAAGELWVTSGGVGQIARRGNGQWTALQDQGSPLAAKRLEPDGQGGMWMAIADRLVHQSGTDRRSWEGLPIGQVRGLHQAPDALWVSGTDGVLRLSGDRLLKLSDDLEGNFGEVMDVRELPDGSLWGHGTTGVFHVSSEAMRQALAALSARDQVLRVAVQRFGASDGWRGTPVALGAKPTMTQDTLGRLWFATDTGVSWLDPLGAVTTTRHIVPYLRSITAAGTTAVVAERATIEPQADRVEIAYGAVDLNRQDRLRFRYRLLGVDLRWQLAGNRRFASYTHLPPGDYEFQLAVADADGPWSDPVSIKLDVQAAWFQSWWFKAACLLATLALATSAYRLRVRLITRRVRQLMLERQQERERIGQDLHDTLLQTLYGAILRVDHVARKLPEGHSVRDDIQAEVAQLEVAVDETRAVVSLVREEEAKSASLSEELERYGRSVSAPRGMRFTVHTEGSEPALSILAHEETRAIVREALLNASRHSGGDQLHLALRQGPGGLEIEVQDNGKGMPLSISRDGRPGHWGLTGMRARALRIKASLRIQSEPGRGTTVLLRLRP